MRRAAGLWALLLAGCAGSDGDETVLEGTWTLDGTPVADVTLTRTDEAWRLTRRYEADLAGERHRWRVSETAWLDEAGALQRWSLEREDGAMVAVTFDPPQATWSRSDADGRTTGSFPLERRPSWPVLPAVGAGRLWDGAALRVRAVEGASDRRGWSLSDGSLTWTGRRAEGAPITWTESGGTLAVGGRTGGAVDPVALTRLRVEGLPETDPRSWMHLQAAWADGAVLQVDRPHPLELASDGSPPPPEADGPGIVHEPPPVDLGLAIEPGSSRRVRVRRVLDEVARRVEYRPRPFPPTVSGALQRGWGDCDDRAALMVGALAFLTVPARTVQGLLVTPEGLVPHAWVEVRYGGSLGWVPADPTFGQEVADAGRVRLDDLRLARTVVAPLRVVKAR